MADAFEPPDQPTVKKNKDGTTSTAFIKRHESYVAIAKQGGVDLLLMGDFLVDDFRGNNKNGVKAIYDKTKILLLPVIPWDANPGGRRDRHCAVNRLLPTLDDGGKTVRYLDISGKFLAPDGTIPKDAMPDGAHLSDKGYQIGADAIAAPLKEMMQGK
ncbi:MAG: hypothetical protein NTX50_22480 [Candidatus Sumerlaeota bacterium]|nr:hypothetical protein [Candidatus Sumerlaeota bacterium]